MMTVTGPNIVFAAYEPSLAWLHNLVSRRGLSIWRNEEWRSDTEFAVPGDAVWVHRKSGHLEVVTSHAEGFGYVQQIGRDIFLRAFGSSDAGTAQIASYYRGLLPTAEIPPEELEVTFWYYTSQGPRSYSRRLLAPNWSDIAINYPKDTHEKLVHLQQHRPGDVGGKLILWQGVPGTGKSWSLRALAKGWQSWCRAHYVLDPEKFFNEGSYLLQVILDAQDQPSAANTGGELWRLIILEDTGEMLRKDAKEHVGQGLARLLNLCDGLLGQGLRIMLLITTNEETGVLHEAVTRSGRCLSRITFETFTPEAANDWLRGRGRTDVKITRAVTLADLYAVLSGENIEVSNKRVGFGGQHG